MIEYKEKVKISYPTEYITQWVDNKGNYEIEKLLKDNQKVIIDKTVTGCGFTTYALCSSENVILVSPRIKLIQNKEEQFNEKERVCFYFNRELKKKKKFKIELKDLINDLKDYYKDRKFNRKPLKILVTYDSFCNLVDILETSLRIKVSSSFRIVVDESHCLIKDLKMKEFMNTSTISTMLQKIFTYPRVLFISATPIIDYMKNVPEFRDNPVDYYELEWENVQQISVNVVNCRSSLAAFDKIYEKYDKNLDPQGTHIFDTYYSESIIRYSYEAVIFLNNVKDIASIISKYVGRLQLIDISDIGVLCSSSDNTNEKKLKKVNSKVNILKSVPKEGKPHPRWLFVTKTAFEGVDFYSESASTYIIANYTISSLSLDIASDIPQIMGRQRLKRNLFRNFLTMFVTCNENIMDDSLFEADRNNKMSVSVQQIEMWNSLRDEFKELALQNVATVIEVYPNSCYLKTTNGIPEINELLMISEDYCRDILRNHLKWFVMAPSTDVLYPELRKLREELENPGYALKDRLEVIIGFYETYPRLLNEIFEVLKNNGYTKESYYFYSLSPDRIKALWYNTTRMDDEIKANRSEEDIKNNLLSYFEQGKEYETQDVKKIIQEVYNNLGLNKKAKATNIEKYLDCKECRIGNKRGYRIY